MDSAVTRLAVTVGLNHKYVGGHVDLNLNLPRMKQSRRTHAATPCSAHSLFLACNVRRSKTLVARTLQHDRR
jgi:hypothetical protein